MSRGVPVFILHFTGSENNFHISLYTTTLMLLSGTTWIQQIVWLIVNSVDGADQDAGMMSDKFSFLEIDYKAVEEIAKQSGRRLLKSHMPYSCLPAAVEAGRGKVKENKSSAINYSAKK